MAAEKYKNKGLAEKLFPIFRESGTIEAVFQYCKKHGPTLTKPTLGKMARYFGWETLREAAQKNQFAASSSGNVIADVDAILQEQKAELYKAMKTSPLNLENHKALGACLASVMKNEELKISARSVDRDALLLSALKATVEFASAKKNEAVVEFMGEYLEEVAAKVKESWPK